MVNPMSDGLEGHATAALAASDATAQGNTPPQRQGYAVDPRFQVKYTGALVLSGLVISLSFGALVYWASAKAQHTLATEISQFRGREWDQSVIDRTVRMLDEAGNSVLALTAAIGLVMT